MDINAAIAHLQHTDPILKRIIPHTQLPTLYWADTMFEDVVSCIVDNQIRYRGKALRYKKMKAFLNHKPITSKHLFSIGEDNLKSLKLSRQKLSALENLCYQWDNLKLDSFEWSKFSDTEIRKLLTGIKGIGNWTADMILLYTLQRENIVPFDDFHLKRVMKMLYDINDTALKTEMKYIAEDWSPYSSIAVLYLLEFKNTTK